MKKLPKIGLTMYGQNDERHFTIPSEYINSITRAGGLPIVMPPIDEPHHFLCQIDGLILIGGGDVCPSCYEQESHETVYMTDSQRDRYELDLFKAALDVDIPVFGICRGIQVMNIALGGSLHQHLPDVVGDEVRHRLPPREPVNHTVFAEPDSRLATILQTEEFDAPSWHHQAVDKVAEPFVAVAYARDNTIEALELPDHKWCIAVQWHPELAPDDPIQQRLFTDFINHCKS